MGQAEALLHAALTRQSVRLWLGFFTLCAVIGVTRSTFHLLWLAVMLCLGLWFSTPRDRRRVLAAACAPAALVVAQAAKTLQDGMALARNSLETGAAKSRLDKLKSVSNAA